MDDTADDFALLWRHQLSIEPIYCAAPSPSDPGDIVYPGSDDELSRYERVEKRLRYEQQGCRYLDGKPLQILSASLSGPFDKASGWQNPWLPKQPSQPTESSSAAQHNIGRLQESSSIGEDETVSDSDDSMDCQVPSPNEHQELETPHDPSNSEKLSHIEAWAKGIHQSGLEKDEFWAPNQSLASRNTSCVKRRAAAGWLKRRGAKRPKTLSQSTGAASTPTPTLPPIPRRQPTKESAIARLPSSRSFELTTPSSSNDECRGSPRNNATEDEEADCSGSQAQRQGEEETDGVSVNTEMQFQSFADDSFCYRARQPKENTPPIVSSTGDARHLTQTETPASSHMEDAVMSSSHSDAARSSRNEPRMIAGQDHGFDGPIPMMSTLSTGGSPISHEPALFSEAHSVTTSFELLQNNALLRYSTRTAHSLDPQIHQEPSAISSFEATPADEVISEVPGIVHVPVPQTISEIKYGSNQGQTVQAEHVPISTTTPSLDDESTLIGDATEEELVLGDDKDTVNKFKDGSSSPLSSLAEFDDLTADEYFYQDAKISPQTNASHSISHEKGDLRMSTDAIVRPVRAADQLSGKQNERTASPKPVSSMTAASQPPASPEPSPAIRASQQSPWANEIDRFPTSLKTEVSISSQENEASHTSSAAIFDQSPLRHEASPFDHDTMPAFSPAEHKFIKSVLAGDQTTTGTTRDSLPTPNLQSTRQTTPEAEITIKSFAHFNFSSPEHSYAWPSTSTSRSILARGKRLSIRGSARSDRRVSFAPLPDEASGDSGNQPIERALRACSPPPLEAIDPDAEDVGGRFSNHFDTMNRRLNGEAPAPKLGFQQRFLPFSQEIAQSPSIGAYAEAFQDADALQANDQSIDESREDEMKEPQSPWQRQSQEVDAVDEVMANLDQFLDVWTVDKEIDKHRGQLDDGVEADNRSITDMDLLNGSGIW
ncbi:hypothetical protein F5Y18DRAFT_383488 [Xylariaceae sp. FL1019]|nr:hypothetical protein F5Y18DRAFT_383488 [Xylariaceae sp. FL1019]